MFSSICSKTEAFERQIQWNRMRPGGGKRSRKTPEPLGTGGACGLDRAAIEVRAGYVGSELRKPVGRPMGSAICHLWSYIFGGGCQMQWVQSQYPRNGETLLGTLISSSSRVEIRKLAPTRSNYSGFTSDNLTSMLLPPYQRVDLRQASPCSHTPTLRLP